MNDASSVGNTTACGAMKTCGGYGVQRSIGKHRFHRDILRDPLHRPDNRVDRSCARAATDLFLRKSRRHAGVVTHGICSTSARGVDALGRQARIGASSNGDSVGRADQNANGTMNSTIRQRIPGERRVHRRQPGSTHPAVIADSDQRRRDKRQQPTSPAPFRSSGPYRGTAARPRARHRTPDDPGAAAAVSTVERRPIDEVGVHDVWAGDDAADVLQ